MRLNTATTFVFEKKSATNRLNQPILLPIHLAHLAISFAGCPGSKTPFTVVVVNSRRNDGTTLAEVKQGHSIDSLIPSMVWGMRWLDVISFTYICACVNQNPT